jgi:DNA-binding MarR family transcriptional regulator
VVGIGAAQESTADIAVDATVVPNVTSPQRVMESWNRATRAFSAPHVFEERRRLARSPLTDPTHERVLEMIAERGPVRLSAVAESTFMTPSNASKVADSLVRAGLVERTVPPDDRRVTLLALTDAGSALVGRVHAVAMGLLSERLRRFTPDEVETLAVLLEMFSFEVEQWSAAVRTRADEQPSRHAHSNGDRG